MGEKAGEDFELPEFRRTSRLPVYVAGFSDDFDFGVCWCGGRLCWASRAYRGIAAAIAATDQWSYYQAKNIRFHEVQGMRICLAHGAADKEKNGGASRKIFEGDGAVRIGKEDISEKAKEFEKERDLISRRADRFDGGEALLEVGW